MTSKISSDLYSKLIKDLNVVVFKYIGDDLFEVTGNCPDWILGFITKDKLSATIDLKSIFPFLEIFIPQFISSDKTADKKLYSDVWTEVNKSGEERYLQAIGLNIDGERLLMIISHEGVLFKDPELLQKGRENVLLTEKITKTKNELERLLKFKDQFVSIVSHDLRSPVSSVVSITKMMLADEDFKNNLSDVYLDFIKTMNKEMQLLLDYNEKLYYWSNLQLGKFKIELKEIILKDLLNETKNRFNEKADEKNISINLDIQENLCIKADESLFTQVLTNLVGNAVKFTPPNGHISIEAKKENNEIIIKIADTGVGIKPEVVRDLFSGYVKEHNSGTNGEKGTGLGLGIVKRIIDAHGFKIDVKSEVNKGTEFIIIIPLGN